MGNDDPPGDAVVEISLWEVDSFSSSFAARIWMPSSLHVSSSSSATSSINGANCLLPVLLPGSADSASASRKASHFE